MNGSTTHSFSHGTATVILTTLIEALQFIQLLYLAIALVASESINIFKKIHTILVFRY